MTDRSPTDGLVSAVRSDDGDGVDSAATRSAADAASDGTPDTEALSERLAAVERAVGVRESDATDAGGDDHEATDAAALRRRLDELEARVDELDAATRAVRGYVGSVRAVNEEVERRADLALAVARDAAGNDAAESDVEDRSAEGAPTLPSDADIEGALPDDPAATAAIPDDGSGGADRRDADSAVVDGRADRRDADSAVVDGRADRRDADSTVADGRADRRDADSTVADGRTDDDGTVLDRLRESL